jgi:ribosomal protein S18 acetylase RimI-like enzyme
MQIVNSTIKDIDEIYRLYKIATAYQQAKKEVIVWPDFKREMVEIEIAENRQFKMLINNEVACIWVITFNDEQIWEEKNKDPAIYIHRIATNQNFRGNNLVAKIVDWAIEYANQSGIQFVRLDTLGNNTRLIEHYKNAGFDFLGLFDLKNTDRLPKHYKLAPVCLFEIDLHRK